MRGPDEVAAILELPDHVLDQIIDITHVLPLPQLALKEEIRAIVLLIEESRRLFPREVPAEKVVRTDLKRIAKAAHSLAAALEQAHADTFAALLYADDADEEKCSLFDPFPYFVETRRLAAVARVAAAIPHSQWRSKRRPKEHAALQMLIEMLYIKIVAQAGGKLTLGEDRAGGRKSRCRAAGRLNGTLPEVMEALQPFVSPDIVPGKLTYSMLQRPLARAKLQLASAKLQFK